MGGNAILAGNSPKPKRPRMKTFHCQCGNTVYFENDTCLECGCALGFIPQQLMLRSIEPIDQVHWQAHESGGQWRRCANFSEHRICNWLLPANDPHRYCPACRLNAIIPNLSVPENRVRWYRIEVAKRRLLYSLLALGLPVVGRNEDPVAGLAFRFEEDPAGVDEFSDMTENGRVLTGHHNGVITINVLEADHSAREQMRERMNEAYRTLLGHFRHESGHYYWTRLLNNDEKLQRFRDLFGDERIDYEAAMQRHYNEGPARDWPQRYISAYASMHPWEDWAECWAHYLHMVETLDTAADYGFQLHGRMLQPPYARTADFDQMLEDWRELTLAMNDLNRSMGLGDAYPFGIPDIAREKLRYIHHLIHA